MILGKFVGGLSVIAVLLTALTTFVAGIGIFRLGLIPEPTEIARLLVWLLVAVIYVGFLAGAGHVDLSDRSPGGYLSDDRGRAFGSYSLSSAASCSRPRPQSWPIPMTSTSSLRAELLLSRLSPFTLFSETSTVLLDPTERTTGLVTIEQVSQALVSNLSITQSLSVVWPQIVALVAMSTALFAIAYVAFMRQEVRA